jgi:hypothetical protein
MKDFIPYKEAVAVKKLGFNEPCFRFQNNISHTIEERGWLNWNYVEKFISLPLFSQAFRFFREKYNLHSYIEGAYPWFRFYINSEDDRWEGHKEMTYEEAELACLRKLIEIVKQKQ